MSKFQHHIDKEIRHPRQSHPDVQALREAQHRNRAIATDAYRLHVHEGVPLDRLGPEAVGCLEVHIKDIQNAIQDYYLTQDEYAAPERVPF